jgi:hypothetical protein
LSRIFLNAGADGRECSASTVGGKDDDEERTRGLYLVKLIANDDLHDFR